MKTGQASDASTLTQRLIQNAIRGSGASSVGFGEAAVSNPFAPTSGIEAGPTARVPLAPGAKVNVTEKALFPAHGVTVYAGAVSVGEKGNLQLQSGTIFDAGRGTKVVLDGFTGPRGGLTPLEVTNFSPPQDGAEGQFTALVRNQSFSNGIGADTLELEGRIDPQTNQAYLVDKAYTAEVAPLDNMFHARDFDMSKMKSALQADSPAAQTVREVFGFQSLSEAAEVSEQQVVEVFNILISKPDLYKDLAVPGNDIHAQRLLEKATHAEEGGMPLKNSELRDLNQSMLSAAFQEAIVPSHAQHDATLSGQESGIAVFYVQDGQVQEGQKIPAEIEKAGLNLSPFPFTDIQQRSFMASLDDANGDAVQASYYAISFAVEPFTNFEEAIKGVWLAYNSVPPDTPSGVSERTPAMSRLKVAGAIFAAPVILAAEIAKGVVGAVVNMGRTLFGLAAQPEEIAHAPAQVKAGATGFLSTFLSGDFISTQLILKDGKYSFDTDRAKPNVMAINGMDNDWGDGEEMLGLVKKAFGVEYGVRIANDNNFGIIGDAFQSFFYEAFGKTYDSPVANSIAAMRQAIQEKGEVYVVAHSQGTAIFLNAIQFLAPEERRKIHYYGAGSEAFVDADKWELGSARNVWNDKDGVPKWANNLNPMTRLNPAYRGRENRERIEGGDGRTSWRRITVSSDGKETKNYHNFKDYYSADMRTWAAGKLNSLNNERGEK